jgi:hypothetical protein
MFLVALYCQLFGQGYDDDEKAVKLKLLGRGKGK